jgi:hypothetical protein
LGVVFCITELLQQTDEKYLQSNETVV